MNDARVAETVLRAFEGDTAPQHVLDRIRDDPPAGFTLFSYDNVVDVDQVAELTASLEAANPSDLPLLVATDQEGGQLIALVGTTDFPGNMALGAAGDPELTERVGRAVGAEMLAVGVNLNYAPVADLNTNPHNPGLGIRSFGDDPRIAAAHVAAIVRGLGSAGVLSTLKHFPGKGHAQVDSHYGLPVIDHERSRLDDVELVPFVAGMEAGADLVMTGHFAIPGITERADLPSTLSKAVLTGLLRDQLGFGGAIITDAFDMGAISQGAGQLIDAIAAVRAGVDLMLLKGESQEVLERGIALANHRGIVPDDRLADAVGRTRRLRQRVAAAARPDLSVVGSPEHRGLARQAAARAVTLVRDDAGLLPLKLETGQRIAAVMPRPTDLTPADTSARVEPGLASALRGHHGDVDEFVVEHSPTSDEIAWVCDQVASHDLVVLGTVSASLEPAQVSLAEALARLDVPIVAVALRTPYDVEVVAVPTAVCTYGLRPASLEALADALFGTASFPGRLPVAVSVRYPRGHGITGSAR